MKKELPRTDIATDGLFQLPYEALKWELLKTAIEFGLFDRTVEPVAAAAIADALSLHSENTEHMLDALVALGCLSKTDGEYQNTPLADRFLTSNKDTSLGATLLFMAGWTVPVLNGGLKDLVQNGPPPQKNLANPEIWENAARVSVNHSRCGRAQLIARHVSELPEFATFARIIDLGAGPGIMGIAVAAAHPSLECVVFDQPAVCKVATEVVAEYGMGNRVKVASGNYMEDDFGTGFDFIMANFTLNFYRDRLDRIMDKALKALKPGGIFMVTSDGLSRDKTAPAGSVISWLPTMLQGNDMSFETGRIARAMLDAGFASTEQKTITDLDLQAHGPIEMTIGRKER